MCDWYRKNTRRGETKIFLLGFSAGDRNARYSYWQQKELHASNAKATGDRWMFVSNCIDVFKVEEATAAVTIGSLGGGITISDIDLEG